MEGAQNEPLANGGGLAVVECPGQELGQRRLALELRQVPMRRVPHLGAIAQRIEAERDEITRKAVSLARLALAARAQLPLYERPEREHLGRKRWDQVGYRAIRYAHGTDDRLTKERLQDGTEEVRRRERPRRRERLARLLLEKPVSRSHNSRVQSRMPLQAVPHELGNLGNLAGAIGALRQQLKLVVCRRQDVSLDVRSGLYVQTGVLQHPRHFDMPVNAADVAACVTQHGRQALFVAQRLSAGVLRGAYGFVELAARELRFDDSLSRGLGRLQVQLQGV